MRTVETSAPTIEQAVDAALNELGVQRDQVEIEVLEEPNKGFFGLVGQKNARVRVSLNLRKADYAEKFILGVAGAINIPVEVERRENDRQIYLNLKGPQMGLLIGHRGQTLNALQYLVNVAAGKVSKEQKRIMLDAEGYRNRREKMLERLALRSADKARRCGEKVALEPMNAHERKLIHLALQENPHVSTQSEGEEPFRRVVVSPIN